MMHARYATCGGSWRGNPNNAHPFRIERNGKTVLYGAHNGCIYNADDSAKKHARNYTVDSRELFELLADNATEEIQNLSGYGVITWIDTKQQGAVNMARISTSSEIYVCKVKSGGYVWGSTEKIVKEALKDAGLKKECHYDLNDIGRVYQFRPTGIFETDRTGIKVGSRSYTYVGGYGGWDYGDDDAYDWRGYAERYWKGKSSKSSDTHAQVYDSSETTFIDWLKSRQ